MMRVTSLGLALSVLLCADEAWAASAHCTFERSVTTSISDDGTVEAQFKENASDSLDLRFIDMDEANGLARLVGNAGVSPVFFLPGQAGQFSFVEMTQSGNLNTTTVFAVRSYDGKSHATHSRHINFGSGGAIYSQWAGTCLLSDD